MSDDPRLPPTREEWEQLQQRLATAEALLREACATAGQWECLARYGIVMTQEWMTRAKEVCGE